MVMEQETYKNDHLVDNVEYFDPKPPSKGSVMPYLSFQTHNSKSTIFLRLFDCLLSVSLGSAMCPVLLSLKKEGKL